MDIQTYLATYWQPMLIGAVIGIILGWLVTYLPMRGRARDAEATIADLSSRVGKAETEAKSSTTKLLEMENDLSVQQVRYNTAQSQISSLKGEMEALTGQKNAVDASLLERARDLDAARAQIAKLANELAEAQEENTQLGENAESLSMNLESTAVELAKVKETLTGSEQTLGNKEVALNEAYLRAVKLQRELMEHQTLLAETQTELAEARRNLSSLSTYNSDLEGKLQNARGEVAGELALLTSTMLRMKEEALNQANQRNAALTAELESMRAGKVSSY